MKTYKQMLLANRAWAEEIIEQDADFFTRQRKGQRPSVFWIGSSDSRVSPEQMTRTLPGELFIHRNMANLVAETDMNFMSDLQYAVTVLQVRDIIVCGHYGDEGLAAILDGTATGDIKTWLENASAVLENHRSEIMGLPAGEERLNRFVECNVQDQLVDVARTKVVRDAFAAGQDLTLHGWVYDLRDGHLKELLQIDGSTDLSQLAAAPRSVLNASGNGTSVEPQLAGVSEGL
jgi:carbonic anhydrase